MDYRSRQQKDLGTLQDFLELARMRIQHSANAGTLKEISGRLENILPSISEVYLQHVIQTISVPRHYCAEKANNERIARWIRGQFKTFGFQTSFHRRFRNIVALPATQLASSSLLASAHYDTVPGSPGADDNGSGIATPSPGTSNLSSGSR